MYSFPADQRDRCSKTRTLPSPSGRGHPGPGGARPLGDEISLDMRPGDVLAPISHRGIKGSYVLRVLKDLHEFLVALRVQQHGCRLAIPLEEHRFAAGQFDGLRESFPGFTYRDRDESRTRFAISCTDWLMTKTSSQLRPSVGGPTRKLRSPPPRSRWWLVRALAGCLLPCPLGPRNRRHSPMLVPPRAIPRSQPPTRNLSRHPRAPADPASATSSPSPA